jgi:hypothetical protein
MNPWVIVASIATTAIAVALAFLLVRTISYRRPATGDDVLPEFSLSRYQPMTQLMAGDDLHFFSQQSGVTRAQQQSFKRNRRRIFRLFLRELADDFHVLHCKAREIVADSPEGSGALIGSLLRLQINFWRFLALVEMQLVLDQIGLGTVDSRRLLETINSLHVSISRASSSPGPIMV